MSGQIFISYRREESHWSARSVYDRLCRDFDRRQIFMDIDAIALGEDFVSAIETTVSKCAVLVAVIGNNWLTTKNEHGERRLDNPEDFVRMEIATALKRGIRVIPVTVDGALMPRSLELPEDLKPLARRNALGITHTSFDGDCQRLTAAIREVLERAQAEEKERLEAEQREKERLAAELREKERREARQREQEEKERFEAERREGEEKKLAEAERRQKEQQERREAEQQDKERLEHESQAQLPTSVAPSTPAAKPEADKLDAETPKLVYPLRPKPTEPKREKSPSPSSGGTGGKSPSKQVIAFLAIAAVLVVGGLIYLAIRASPLPPPQPVSVAAVTPSPPAIAPPIVEEKARSSLEGATKDHPWVNSLGMEFVPVPGTQVLFSIWDTRVQDFRIFVEQSGYSAGPEWKNPEFDQGPTHPVVNVNWDDGKAFCAWLTQKEHASGRLLQTNVYRLPTDKEWSKAVGLGNESGITPAQKSGRITHVYPWGKQWPPPDNAGNYAGNKHQWSGGTSPVGSFAANQYGLYDMGGNVFQWCEDWYDQDQQEHVLRGASWNEYGQETLLSSTRLNGGSSTFRNAGRGFRCVVAPKVSAGR